jgi:hypothetical protein
VEHVFCIDSAQQNFAVVLKGKARLDRVRGVYDIPVSHLSLGGNYKVKVKITAACKSALLSSPDLRVSVYFISNGHCVVAKEKPGDAHILGYTPLPSLQDCLKANPRCEWFTVPLTHSPVRTVGKAEPKALKREDDDTDNDRPTAEGEI